MTSTMPAEHERSTEDKMTVDTVADAIEDLFDSLPGESMQFFSILTGHIQESRRNHYSHQKMYEEVVVRIMGGILRLSQPQLVDYMLSMLGMLLLDPTRGERRLRCQDWSMDDKPCIVLFIIFD